MRRLLLIALLLAAAPALGAQQSGAGRAVHAVHAAQRAARHPARGPHGAAGHGERLVPRGIGARETGADGVRAPVRAPHVHGHRSTRSTATSTSCSKRPAGPTTPRPPKTAPTTTSTCPRTRWTWRCSSNPTGWPTCSTRCRPRPSTPSATWSRTSAARATRTRPTAWRRSRSRRCCIRRGIRTDGRPSATWRISRPPATRTSSISSRPTTSRRNASLVVAGDIDTAKTQGLGREVVRRRQAGDGPDRADRLSAAEPDRGQEEDHPGSRAAAAALPDVDHAGAFRARGRRARRAVAAAGGRQELAPLQAARLRAADRAGRRRLPGVEDAELRVSDRRDGASRRVDRQDPRGRGRGDREDPAGAADLREFTRAINQIESSFYDRMERVGISAASATR